ncbi:MAG: universal stress protein [Saprospiraceae bacterium]|nr:universal stress protein [Saprospiraceae bacterium]
MNILCPIDFSDHSLYALDYAINLGNQLGARLIYLPLIQFLKVQEDFALWMKK